MKKKIIFLGTIGIVLFSLVLGTLDSHHTNVKYLLWKHGWTGYEPLVALKYLNVDVSFRLSLQGKSKVEINELFTDLRPMGNANEYQQLYGPDLNDADFLWIGDSAWGILFDDGKVKDIRLFKG